MSHLRDQVAIVTGGGSGIGLAISGSLVAEGMRVIIAGRDPKKLDEAAARLASKETKVLTVPTDVSIAVRVEGLVAECMRTYGRIDLFVNNAGIGQWGTITECSEKEWDQVQAINLKGAFLCTKAVIPIMKRQRSGYIVNIASLAGKIGMSGTSVYSASKFGMVGLTQSVLEEVIKYNIRATVICPGYVATPMVAGASVPQDEMIPPQDLGKLVIALLHLSPYTVIKEIVMERKGAIGT
jgi:3-hydroxybutyrate dehydrogenase